MKMIARGDSQNMDEDGRGFFSHTVDTALALWTTPTVVGQKVA